MLRNNRFSGDSDAERWKRLDLLATNIDTYAAELAVAGEKLQWAKGACTAWESARTEAGVELGEKEEALNDFHRNKHHNKLWCCLKCRVDARLDLLFFSSQCSFDFCDIFGSVHTN